MHRADVMTNLAHAADESLLGAWRAGDAAAGRALVERHYEKVARYMYNKAGDAADDLIQAVFLAIVEAREQFRGDCSFRTYLFSIAHRQFLKHLRRRYRGGEQVDLGELRLCDLGPSPSAALHERQELRLLLESLRQIPLDCQEVLELHYWERMTTHDIGAALAIPVGTVRSRLQRGRRLLEAQLAELSHSPALLRSTLADLDGWASELHARLAQPRAG